MPTPAVRLHIEGTTPQVTLELVGVEKFIPLLLPELISNRRERLMYSFNNLREVSWELREHGVAASQVRAESDAVRSHQSLRQRVRRKIFLQGNHLKIRLQAF